MKRILLIFFIVLLSLPCFAGRIQQEHKAVIAAKNGATPPPAGITFDTSNVFQDGYNAATESWSHTVTGTNNILFVAVSYRTGGQIISGITYNGVALTNIDYNNPGNLGTDVWYLINPATGANTVEVSFSSNGNVIQATSTSLSGVDQSTPLGTKVETGGTGTASTVDANSATGEVVIDFLGIRIAEALTAGANQTERVDSSYSTTISSGVSTEAGAATTTMSWSWTTSVTYSHIAIPIKPAS